MSVSAWAMVVSALPWTMSSGAPAGRLPAEFSCSSFWINGIDSGSCASTVPVVPVYACKTASAHCVVATLALASAAGVSTAAGSASGYAACKPSAPMTK